ncbi:MAG: recombinase family protein [Novosphingobium sp.]|jgi:site-specific DNA recombinase|uniref:recombinase family protein n=1 Tax=Novosphingobium sp. TaxID=1874826 RepID=UPI0022C6E847|nr:recombinase family protein [Novosphingobium sp.]MCZ8036497.1 recombinase family protein [Novosphingobium sp.]
MSKPQKNDKPLAPSDGKPLIPAPAAWYGKALHLTSPKKGVRAAIYARYSSDGQREFSIERQIEAATAYIAGRGFENTNKIYADRAKTGTTIEGRDELHKLLDDAKSGLFDIVVIESWSRLSREIRDSINVFADLQKLGIVLHTANHGEMDVLRAAISGAMSEQDHRNILTLMKNGIQSSVKDGKFVTFGFGYHKIVKNGRVVVAINEEEAAVVRKIFDLFIRGTSPKAIARALNAEDALRPGERPWTAAALIGAKAYGRGLLRNIRYTGRSVHGRNTQKKINGVTKVIVNPVDSWVIGENEELRIISDDVFNDAQRELERRSRQVEEGESDRPRFTAKGRPLNGLIKCERCGGGVTPKDANNSEPRLMCNNARNDDTRCTHTRTIALSRVELAVRDIIIERIDNADNASAFAEEFIQEKEAQIEAAEVKVKDLEARKKVVESRIERFLDEDYVSNVPDHLVQKKKRELAEELHQIYEDIRALSAVKRVIVDRQRIPSLRQALNDLFSFRDISLASVASLEVMGELKKIVKKVVIEFQGDKEYTVHVHLGTLELAGLDEPSEEHGRIEIISRHYSKADRSFDAHPARRERLAEIADSGQFELTDEEWQQLEHLVPDRVALGRGEGVKLDKRNIVNAAILHIETGTPLNRMPEKYGPQKAVLNALRRLSEGGGWDAIVEKIMELRPSALNRRETKMFPTYRVRNGMLEKQLIRENWDDAFDTAQHITDEQWQIIERFFPIEVVQLGHARPFITPRHFADGLFFKLHNRISDELMPPTFGTPNQFQRALKRFVAHGCWDRLVKHLKKTSPSMLEGIDTTAFRSFSRVKNPGFFKSRRET